MSQETYSGASEIARAHGVTRAAVYQWMRKAGWPIPKGEALNRAKVDEYVAGYIAPHRKGEQKRPAVSPSKGPPEVASPPAAPVEAQSSSPAPATATPDAPLNVETASLEELERRIRGAQNSDEAERLSKQVRALKVVREIQDDDGQRIDTERARAEIRGTFHFFQSATMNVPRSVAASLEGLLAAEIEIILEGRLTELLGELKRGLQRAIEFEADAPVVGGDAGRADRSREAEAEPDGRTLPDSEPAAVIAAG